MAALELDPVFVKALGYLRSRSKDSTDQLKAMLDEALAGTSRGRYSKQDSESSKRSGTRHRDDKAPTPCIKLAATEGSRKEAERRAEKRAGERLKSETKLDPPVSKKPRSEKQRKPVIEDDEDEDDPDDDNDNEEEVEEGSMSTEDSSKDDTGDSNHGDSNHGDSNHGSTDADDFALELGLACIVCKQLEVSAGNQLIECQECHSLYHQLCHKPPASEADPNDPRLVWYCSRCTRNMKKQVTKKVKSSSTTSHVAKETTHKETESKADPDQVMNIFKRAEHKSSSSVPAGSSSKTPYTGLASFAANLTGRTSTNNKSGSSSKAPSSVNIKPGTKVSPVPSPVSKTVPKGQGSSKVSGHQGKNVPQSSTASAMKRLQQMKKKASSKR